MAVCTNFQFGREPDPSIDSSSHVTQLCREFGGVTICRKGQEDILADGKDGKKFGFYVLIETCEYSVFAGLH